MSARRSARLLFAAALAVAACKRPTTEASETGSAAAPGAPGVVADGADGADGAGRDPTVEPALVDVTLGAFAIDALPFPNDPAAPAKSGAPIEEAVRLCRDRGARLCTKLEWERACKGPGNDVFAMGARWSAQCEREPARCGGRLGGGGARPSGAARCYADRRWRSARAPSDVKPRVTKRSSRACA